MTARAASGRLSREDWTAAALAALERGGLAAVAVEPLAAALGTTKGSGYWHFANRADLVAATLERWESDHTAATIALVERVGPPAEKLRFLLSSVVRLLGDQNVELALLAHADDPVVSAAVERVTRLRLDYVARLFGELGCPPADARQRSLLAYSIYLGHAQLARTSPDALPTGQRLDRYLATVFRAVTADLPPS